ncbi:MAG: hypothetical protein Kow00117_10740 [Phototrophicales bacterium]
MQLTCIHCGKPIPANNINIKEQIALCPHCDTLFHFEANRKRKPTERIIVMDSADELRLLYQYYSRKELTQYLAAVMVLAVIAFVLFVAPGIVLTAIGTILGAGVFLALEYLLNNRLYIIADKNGIRTRTGSVLRFFANKIVKRDHIQRVVCGESAGGHTVYIINHKDKPIKLLGYLSESQARFIVERINEFYTTPLITRNSLTTSESSVSLNDLLNQDSEQAKWN